jgi:hydroxyethylthiazole kinase
MKSSPYQLLEKVRQQMPVVHHITNWVTIYDCAQVVKTLGASPVMAHARKEVPEMVAIASAVVLNIGTLTVELVEAMKLAAKIANERKIPVVLDACGAGATRLRDEKCLELLEEARIDILKGNASEIARLAGQQVATRGVDATDVAGDLGVLAEQLARHRNLTVVITGKVDLVSNGARTWFVRNGHPMMSSVVGTGCMAASVIGAFAAVGEDLAHAAASALACYGIAGELAAETAAGPASFKTTLIDSLYHLDRATVERKQKIEP